MSFLNLFGGGDSTSSTTTENRYTTNTDASKMFGDNAVDGSGNSWLDFSNRSTNFADMSDRSTQFLDNSNRSTNFTDNSDRSYSGNTGSFNTTSFSDNSVRMMTDFGSVGAALSSMQGLGGSAVASNGMSTLSALDSVKYQAAVNASSVEKAFGIAKEATASVERTAADILGFAANAANLPTNSSTQKAADAKANLQKMALIAGAVIIGLFVLKRA